MIPKNAVIGKCVIWPTEPVKTSEPAKTSEPVKTSERTGLRCSLRLENAAEQLWQKRHWQYDTGNTTLQEQQSDDRA